MGVLLEDLIKLPCFKEAKLVAGSIKDKDIKVEGVTIIEVPDIADWIKGGELLLTSFYTIDKDVEAQKFLVKTIAEKGAAAIIIKTSRFLKIIPDDLIKLANQLDFPIIEISGDTRYIDITYPVMGEIFSDQVNKLNYYKECHKKFTKLSLEMKGTFDVAEGLGELIENPVVIFNSDFSPIAWNDSKYKDLVIVEENLQELVEKGYPFYGVNAKISPEDDSNIIIIVDPIQILNDIEGYLGVIEANKIMQGLDFIALESASTALRLQMLKDLAVKEVELKYQGDLIDDIINKRIVSLDSIYDRANIFGWNLKRRFVLVLIDMKNYESYIDSDNPAQSLHYYMERIKRKVSRISYYYVMDKILIDKADKLMLLWPLEETKEVKEIYNNIKSFGREVKESIGETMKHTIVSMGIGGLADNPLEISKSYSEARDALEYGDRVFGQGSITTFEELGIYKLLCRYEDRDQLVQFVHPALIKLKEYDKDKNNELLETLEVYLSCNLNAVKTAEELYVHYKTVLYRLNRIKEITKLNIEDRGKMLEIEVGLKVLHIIK